MMEPIKLRLQNGGRAFAIEWEDGSMSLLTAGVLRANCRSARALRDRLDGCATEPAPDIAIVAVEPIGAYAVNLAFSDGQARGIYPWTYLRELAALERDGI
ncbi:MAG: DUF971 domain-containing protein [Acetobacteraceae bacterium]|nr:DUF971 domain-containing protein [Acetobacteraceae bacterium]